MLIAIILPNQKPSLGHIGAFYFEVMNQSQVWIDLEPQNSEPGPNPVKLNFTVAFPGHEIAHVPGIVQVRAEANLSFPHIIRQPILRFQFDDGSELDLTAPGRTFQFLSRCDGCFADMILASVPFSDLGRIARSRSLTIEALGFATHMKPADLQALREYMKTIQNGVRIKVVYY